MTTDLELCLNEGWELTEKSTINVNGREYPITHPYRIYLNIYKESTIVEEKLHAMYKVHDFLWPQYKLTNNYWQERIFRAHCENWNHIILASGAGVGKSRVTGQVGFMWWLANPTERTLIVSSTTLDSLESRIWGYIVSLSAETAIPIPIDSKEAKPPKILFPNQAGKIHGCFAVAIREGEDNRTLSTAIGKHPKDGLMVILDECTDITPTIIKAIPNWEQGTPWFQMWGLGNSNSIHDLHGSLAKPEDGWESISIQTKQWKTNHKNGICLYFNPEDSPAIHETDPVKKKALSKFLITKEGLEEKKKQYGTDSEMDYRFVLGFWKSASISEVVVTDKRVKELNPYKPADFSGLYPLKLVGALDAAVDKKGAVMRFGLVGHTTSGDFVLDLRSEKLLHYIDTSPTLTDSQEKQLATNVIYKLKEFKCPLSMFVIDATGLGRLLGELLRALMQTEERPLTMISRRGTVSAIEKEHGQISIAPLEMHEAFIDYMNSGQIKGLDYLSAEQISSRRILLKNGKRILETKEDFKIRMQASNPALAYSPNEADAACLLLQGAIRLAELSLGKRIDVGPQESFTHKKYKAFMLERHQQLQQEQQKETPKISFSPNASFSAGVENVAWQRNK